MADIAAAPERTLPHNLEAEKSVLGAILIHNEAFNHAAELIDSRDFFRDAHRRIFDKMVALSERGDRDRLRHAEGGAVARRASSTKSAARPTSRRSPTACRASANVEYYARIVKEKSTLRSLIHSANKILTEAYEAEQEPDLLLDEAERSIFAIAEDRIRAGLRAAARSGAEQLRDDREAAAAQGAGHRRADRLRRSRRDDLRACSRRT